MSRTLMSLSLALSLALLIGCNPQAPPAANIPSSNTPPSDDAKGKVHVDAPGVKVDVQKKDKDKPADVDVEVKPRRP